MFDILQVALIPTGRQPVAEQSGVFDERLVFFLRRVVFVVVVFVVVVVVVVVVVFFSEIQEGDGTETTNTNGPEVE
jgi:hypothetical protein